MYKIRWRSIITGKTGGGEALFTKEMIDQVIVDLDHEFINIKHWAEPETFDEWCTRNKIKGNYREALYHACMAEGAGSMEDHEELQALWKSQWDKVLKDSLAKL